MTAPDLLKHVLDYITDDDISNLASTSKAVLRSILYVYERPVYWYNRIVIWYPGHAAMLKNQYELRMLRLINDTLYLSKYGYKNLDEPVTLTNALDAIVTLTPFFTDSQVERMLVLADRYMQPPPFRLSTYKPPIFKCRKFNIKLVYPRRSLMQLFITYIKAFSTHLRSRFIIIISENDDLELYDMLPAQVQDLIYGSYYDELVTTPLRLGSPKITKRLAASYRQHPIWVKTAMIYAVMDSGKVENLALFNIAQADLYKFIKRAIESQSVPFTEYLLGIYRKPTPADKKNLNKGALTKIAVKGGNKQILNLLTRHPLTRAH